MSKVNVSKEIVEKINRPLEALKRSGFKLLRTMPTIGERLFGWLGELESTDELKELLVGFDELPLQGKTDRLRRFTELWELFTSSNVSAKARSTPPPKKVDEITEAAPTSFDELTERDITYEKGVGPARAKLLARLGIGSVAELLLHLPRDYQDRRRLTKIARLKVGEQAAVVGELTNLENRRSKRGSRLLGLLSDGTGSVMLTWFNATYLSKILRVGTKLVAFGKVTLYNGPQLINPEFEVVRSTDDPLAAGRVVPFYRLTEGLGMGFMRHLQRRVLDRYLPQLKDYLPEAIRQEQGLQTLPETFEQVHFPQNTDSPLRARRRLAFDGLLLLQLAVLRERQRLDKYTGAEILCEGELPRRLVEKLPFELTAAQQRALERIRGDLNLSRPMNRLLQGDVGSGKTLVALLAMLCAVEAGFQAVLMAPTEVLARQHHHTIS
ncbi:DEAD/DEAH box helicase, partial [bacterium]|nr:DEAD/DEAH box helicase [bacterium]